MSDPTLTEAELRAALAAADRGITLPYGMIIFGAGIAALAFGLILRFADWSNTTHLIVLAAAAFIYGQMIFALSVTTARQNAANARMLRALELLESRLAPR